MLPVAKAELLAVDEEGVLRLMDSSGRQMERVGENLLGAQLACSRDSRAAIVSSTRVARRYDLQKGTSQELRLPRNEICGKDRACELRQVTADSSAQTGCVEMTDSSPATSTGTVIVSLSFPEPPSSELGQCLVMSAPEPRLVSADGRYSVRREEGKCGDYCYETVVVFDEILAKVVKSVEDVVTPTKIEWAPWGTALLIGGTLYDATTPDVTLKLGEDACWLPGN